VVTGLSRSSNGSKAGRPVRRSDLFEARLDEVAEYIPGAREAADAARLQLELDPSYKARQLGDPPKGPNWQIKTSAARGVPPLSVIYTIRPHEVIMQWIDATDRDIPTRLAGDDYR
jgi:hypothetical protein